MNPAARDELRHFASSGQFFRTQAPKLVVWQAPARVESGASVLLRWKASNTKAVHIVLGGVYPLLHRGGAAGELSIVPDLAGEITVQLQLQRDDPAGDWQTKALPSIEVRQRALSLSLAQKRLHAAPDAPVALRWSSDGASQIRVLRARTGEVMVVGAQGQLQVRMGYAPDALTFVAAASDGRTQHAVCELLPSAAHPSEASASGQALNLMSINQPLELRL